MIEIKNLCKAFDKHKIFSDFSLSIKTGELVVLCGESGSGKTTLLNIIGALEKYDKGDVLVDGIDLNNQRNHRSYFSDKVGFLFQNFVLIEDKTVRKNLELIRKTNSSGVSIDEALEHVGLADKIDSKVYTLSGGEQQRVALARLMIKKCDVILADEPTGSLDTKNAERVLSILEELNRNGKTVILVTHDEEIKKRGWRVVEL
ncbi:MAG: ATP-binding cassette domain-containing protein [Oscillospiraceae bacterium]